MTESGREHGPDRVDLASLVAIFGQDERAMKRSIFHDPAQIHARLARHKIPGTVIGITCEDEQFTRVLPLPGAPKQSR